MTRDNGHDGWQLLDKIWKGQMRPVCGEGRTILPIMDQPRLGRDARGPAAYQVLSQ